MPTYKDKTGRWRWRATFRGKRYSGSSPKGNNTRDVAKQLERETIDAVRAGREMGPAPKVKDFAKVFLEHQIKRTKKLTQGTQGATIRKHVIPHIGELRLDKVTTAELDRLTALWPLSAKTINVRMSHVRRMLSLACEWGLIAKVPKFTWLKIPKDTPRFLSEAEAARLLEHAAPQWRSMILVGLRTGLRIGELRGLEWADVDIRRMRIQVRRTDPGRPDYEATIPKGGGERPVPLTPEAAAVLEEMRPRAKGPLVWPGKGPGRPRSEKGCWRGIVTAAKHAGVPDCGWHTLRHTYASWLVMRAVPLRVIQRYLGHASITHTERYANLTPDFGHDSVAMLDIPLPEAPGQQATNESLSSGPERMDLLLLESEVRRGSRTHSTEPGSDSNASDSKEKPSGPRRK